VLRGDLGRLLTAVAVFEVGNVAGTLLILRATELLTVGHGATRRRALVFALLAPSGHRPRNTAECGQ
jgi:hypothetical protein